MKCGSLAVHPFRLLMWMFFAVPVLLMWWLLVGVVKLPAWVWREYATARARRAAPDNRLARPQRHT